MKNHKLAILTLRIFGIISLYNFLEESLRVINMIAGAATRKGITTEAFVLQGLVYLFAGIYLLLYPKKIVYGVLKDAFLVELNEPSSETEAKYIFALSIKMFGLYLFFQFMHNLVTGYNVAASNWTPGDTTASAYVIQAVFHLILSLVFLLKTEKLVEFVCSDKSK